MKLEDIRQDIPEALFNVISKYNFEDLRPCQEKAINAGLFSGKNLVVCTPTASGKTLIAELSCLKNIIEGKGRAIYIVPLKALASEKYRNFRKAYPYIRVGLATGDLDSRDEFLNRCDLVIATAEKMDSLIRHKVPWIKEIHTIVVDETHLLNDPGRGPTLEILITILQKVLPQCQIIALSATIGNPKVLAEWLDAELVEDDWRPVELKSGTYLDGELDFV
ncbi:DEAD/DEAH box helicase [Candidatus Woesearchaeota archaeon]|nr:DEAD/DEAH box helicase [Candidatus Woesearchaeota archaeon]